jgi:acetylglutamate kinase
MNQYVVIKCGGSVLESLPLSFYENIVSISKKGWKPIIVHGGGPLISKLLKKLEIKSQFVNGLRVTTEEVLDVVEMVLSGSVNKQIVQKLTQSAGKAYGISGVDGSLLTVDPSKAHKELGFVGEVAEVNTKIIENILDQGFIPVISPLGIDAEGQRYNINGDTSASAIAKALEAKLCMVSDIPGLYIEENGQRVTLRKATKHSLEQLIENNTIQGGMIPKVKAAIDGLVHNVPEVVILNGMEPSSLLDFCAGKEIGTKIILGDQTPVH